MKRVRRKLVWMFFLLAMLGPVAYAICLDDVEVTWEDGTVLRCRSFCVSSAGWLCS